jgi:hypothetical protein
LELDDLVVVENEVGGFAEGSIWRCLRLLDDGVVLRCVVPGTSSEIGEDRMACNRDLDSFRIAIPLDAQKAINLCRDRLSETDIQVSRIEELLTGGLSSIADALQKLSQKASKGVELVDIKELDLVATIARLYVEKEEN